MQKEARPEGPNLRRVLTTRESCAFGSNANNQLLPTFLMLDRSKTSHEGGCWLASQWPRASCIPHQPHQARPDQAIPNPCSLFQVLKGLQPTVSFPQLQSWQGCKAEDHGGRRNAMPIKRVYTWMWMIDICLESRRLTSRLFAVGEEQIILTIPHDDEDNYVKVHCLYMWFEWKNWV